MIDDMAVLHITEAELARDIASVLDRVQSDTEIVIERDAQPVAIIKSPQFRGRPIDESIALAKTHGSHATLDDEFTSDLEEIISSNRDPLNPPKWGNSRFQRRDCR